MSTRKALRSTWSTPKRSAMTRASWSGVSTPRSTSTSPVRRPLVRDSAMANSTDSRPAYPKPTTMSPICLDERPRADGGVRPGMDVPVSMGTGAIRRLSAAPADSVGWLARGVERLVDERVGRRVLRARHAADAPADEAAEGLLGRRMQGLHVGVLDLVLAVDLLGDELGVVDDLDLVGAQRAGPREPEQQAAVLGHVVRHDAEQLVGLVEHLAVGRRDHGGRRGRPGVAAGAAVDVDDEPHSVAIGGGLPGARGGGTWRGTRERRRSRRSRGSLGSVAPRPRRSLLRRSMMTFTFGSSL